MIQSPYQLRAKSQGTWGEWQNFTHYHPNGGWRGPNFRDAEAIQIRFDRIAGDDEFTENVQA